ncbi:MAG: hypothetical protein HZB41_02650 [Ignavibacteriae bacterium]|nr:hypothetical protein [Ignavibacteriota bacterium]
MNKIGFITSNEQPELLGYDREIIIKLRDREIKAEPVIWDKPNLKWDSFDMLIMRTAWGYHLRHREFKDLLDFIEINKIPIWNPANIMKDNMHKFYLKNLNEAGFNIVPSMFLEPEDLPQISEIVSQTDWKKIVIKPAISAGAADTFAFSRVEQLLMNGKITDIFKGRQFILQKYIEDIQTEGEWANIFFSNGYHYSILKMPKQGDYRVQNDYGGTYFNRKAPEFVYKSAKEIADYYLNKCLYVRVDGVASDGKFYLMEVEMIEPDLYINVVPKAMEPFIESIIQKLQSNI